MPLTVRIITPSGTLWDAPAQAAILPSKTGEMGILAGHVAVTTALNVGVIRLQANGKWIPICIMGGFAQVEGDEVIILVHGAERGDQIDTKEAQGALEQAEDKLSQAQSTEEKLRAKVWVKQARARLKASQASNYSQQKPGLVKNPVSDKYS